MSKFTFIMPNGQLFTLNGPADATQAQAEKIYLEQLSAGALVGLRPGDILENPKVKIEKFTLSRLDRGTAGVADLPLLAINNNEVISALPSLGNVQVANGITTSNFVSTTPTTNTVGPLTSTQLQSLAAQIAVSVNQPANTITQDKGVGKYGLNCTQLENAGYVKPGTACRFLGQKSSPGNPVESQPNPDNFVSVMHSPTIWTGKDNVTTVTDLLANSTLQDNVQQQLMKSSYNQLVQTGQIQTTSTATTQPVGQVYTGNNATLGTLAILGVSAGAALYKSGALSNLSLGNIGGSITSMFSSGGNVLSNFSLSSISGVFSGLNTNNLTGSISNLATGGMADLGGLVSNASKFGVPTTTAWANGLTPDALTSQLNGLAKQGQFAINFSDFKLPTTIAGVVPAAGYTGTIDRQTVDAATAKIIGSNKIPTPAFDGTSIDSTFGGSLSGAGSLLKNVTGSLGLGNLGSLTNKIPGAGALGGLNIGGLTGGLPSISGLPSVSTPGFAGPLNTNALGVNGTGTSSTALTPELMQARKDAYAEVEATQAALEAAVATYGRGSPEYQAAYAAFQAANGRFQALV